MTRNLRSTVGEAWRGRLPDRRLAGLLLVVAGLCSVSDLQAFEGRISAVLMRGGEAQTWEYIAGTNCLRIERGETNWPYAKNLIARDTGNIILLFPHNHSFVRLKPTTENAVLSPPMMMPAMPAPPAGIGPQTHLPPAVPALPAGVGPTNLSGLPTPPAMPPMPVMPTRPPMPAGGMMPAMPMTPMLGEALELKATGETTNILGYVCTRYEIKQRGQVMEIWATDKLLPFQTWLPNQPPRFGSQMLEEKWGGLLQAKRLFPLLAVLKFENGPERLRFSVISVKPQTIAEPSGALFQPPPDYQEIEPLPF